MAPLVDGGAGDWVTDDRVTDDRIVDDGDRGGEDGADSVRDLWCAGELERCTGRCDGELRWRVADADLLGCFLRVVLDFGFDGGLEADRVADFDGDLGGAADEDAVDEAGVDELATAESVVDDDVLADGGHTGARWCCSRSTIRYASDLLCAVIPDSTCERHAGLRSASFRSVLWYTSENLIGPNDAFTPW